MLGKNARLNKSIRGAAAMLLLGGVLLAPALASASEPEWHHATALTGTPKYGPDVSHFDYVNPNAPKGGLARLSDMGGFDTFNFIFAKREPGSRHWADL